MCFVVFLLCLPVRLVLSLCCGVRLQTPGVRPPGATENADKDEDPEVVINMPPETAAPDQVLFSRADHPSHGALAAQSVRK